MCALYVLAFTPLMYLRYTPVVILLLYVLYIFFICVHGKIDQQIVTKKYLGVIYHHRRFSYCTPTQHSYYNHTTPVC